MLSLEAALEKILAVMPCLSSEVVPLNEAFGRFASEPLHASIDLPPSDNSAMDGYAVLSGDLGSASSETPVMLTLVGKIPAGEIFQGSLQAGQCIRIFTGSVLPRGCDAVVMQEDTKVAAEDAGKILFLDKARPWKNVRLRGEDVKTGACVIEPGEKITAPKIALLAAVGVKEITVVKQPVVGLLATGNELREAGEDLPAGGIYESNRVALAALLQPLGAVVKIFPLVPDTLAETRTALKKALNECDVVVTTGGVSVGELDFVKAAFMEEGGELDFWKVNIRPGKPFVFGRWREKFLFGLPGNPVSAMVTFFLLARPALLKLQGACDLSPVTHPAMLAESLSNQGDRRHFARVCVDAKGMARSSGVQAAHVLSGMVSANGLVDVPPQTTLAAGTMVQVMRWD